MSFHTPDETITITAIETEWAKWEKTVFSTFSPEKKYIFKTVFSQGTIKGLEIAQRILKECGQNCPEIDLLVIYARKDYGPSPAETFENPTQRNPRT